MKRILDIIDSIVDVVSTLLIFGILITTLIQVVWRYVFNAPFMWTEELARDLGIWMVLITIGLVLRERRHLGFDILPDSWQPALRLVTNVAVIFFAVFLFRPSLRFMAVAFGRQSPAIRMPLWILYASLPVGLGLLALFAVEGVWKNIRALIEERKNRS